LPYAVVIGVNRAPIITAGAVCDWWAVMDYPLVRDYRRQVPGSPKVLTTQRILERFALPGRSIESLGKLPDSYTAVAAAFLAMDLGCQCIDLYGADWTTAPDADGVELPGTMRTPKRWGREMKAWSQVPCRVRRILPA
jgi:hypothetical protein